jgi:hypothetical protein
MSSANRGHRGGSRDRGRDSNNRSQNSTGDRPGGGRGTGTASGSGANPSGQGNNPLGRGAPGAGSRNTSRTRGTGRSTALSSAPAVTGREHIFIWDHIYYIFNRVTQPDEYEPIEEALKAFSRESRNRDTRIFRKNAWNPGFKPRYALVSA